MPDFSEWISSAQAEDATITRAALAWKRISDKPTNIAVLREGVDALESQTVRIEYSDGVEVADAVAYVGKQRVAVFGVRGHATISDTNLQRGDRFLVGDQMYTVTSVVLQTGEIQASGEAVD